MHQCICYIKKLILLWVRDSFNNLLTQKEPPEKTSSPSSRSPQGITPPLLYIIGKILGKSEVSTITRM